MFAGLSWLIPSLLAKRMGFVGKSNCLLGLLGLQDAQAVNSQGWDGLRIHAMERNLPTSPTSIPGPTSHEKNPPEKETHGDMETLWNTMDHEAEIPGQEISKIQIISTSCTSAGSFLAMWTFAILCKTCASLGTSWWVGDVCVKRPCAAELPAIGVPPFVQKCPVLRATISQPGKSRAACRAQHGHVMPCLMPTSSSSPTDLYTFAASSKASVNFAIDLQGYIMLNTSCNSVRSCSFAASILRLKLSWFLYVFLAPFLAPCSWPDRQSKKSTQTSPNIPRLGF